MSQDEARKPNSAKENRLSQGGFCFCGVGLENLRHRRRTIRIKWLPINP
jgi:hypothetical protein